MKPTNYCGHFFLAILLTMIVGCSNNPQAEKEEAPIDFEKEKQAIMNVLRNATKAYFEKDFAPWANAYVQAPYQIRMGYWEGYKNKIQYIQGWDSLYNHKMRTRFERKSDSEWDESTQEIKNVNMRIFPEVAWATYEQTTFEAGTKRHLGTSLETRILEKKDGEWKIAYLGYLYYPKEKEEAEEAE